MYHVEQAGNFFISSGWYIFIFKIFKFDVIRDEYIFQKIILIFNTIKTGKVQNRV